MGKPRPNELRLIAIATVLAAAIFLLDLSLPLGVAGGVPYVALVLLGWWSSKPRYIFLLAVVSSALTVTGYVYSPEGGIHWIVLTNRFLAFFAIWVTAVLLAKAKGAQMSLQIAHNQLAQQSEAALHDNEARYRAIVEDQTEMISRHTPDGIRTFVNQAYCRFHDKSADQLIGHSAYEAFSTEDLDRQRALFARLSPKDPIGEFEISFPGPNGGPIWQQWTKRAIFDASGRVTEYQAVGRDISERKQLERDLETRIGQLESAQDAYERQDQELAEMAESLNAARDFAEIANQTKSEFLANMSHELRTPLNAIIGFSEVIKDDVFKSMGSDRYRDYANDIHASGKHLLDLINDILDLSKIEAGADQLNEENVELSELLEPVLRLVQQRAEKGGVRLGLELPDQLPALRADARKLKQILLNLMTNAIKFTERGGKVTLSVWCRAESGFVFQIKDTGIGIAPEDIPKALSMFGQIDADLNRHYEGTGLGLSLTKVMAEQHGGSLDLQSQVGVGTTVTVRFPATRIVESLDDTDSFKEVI